MLLLGLEWNVIVPLVSIGRGVGLGAGARLQSGTLKESGGLGVGRRLGLLVGVVGAMAGAIAGLGRVAKKLLVVALIVLGMTGAMAGWTGVWWSGLTLKALLGLRTTGLTGLSLFPAMAARLGFKLTLKGVWGWDPLIRMGVGLGRGGARVLGVGVGVGLVRLLFRTIRRF